MGKKSRQRNRTDAAATAEAPRQPSVRASPARAARVVATRTATAARPAHRRCSWPVRSRDWPVRPTSWRCASSSRPPPRRSPSSAATAPSSSARCCPAAAPALVREDGTIWLGLQVQHSYGDPSRDLAAVLTKALDAEPGSMVGLTEAPGEGPRLQDLVENEPLDVTVHAGFDYWVADLEDADGSMAAALQQANEAAAPTDRLTSVEAAYWTSVGNREYLRWVLPDDEDRVLDGLARLHAADAEHLVDGDRLIGMFRAHGLVVPVWDLPARHRRRSPRGTRRAGARRPARGDRLERAADPRGTRPPGPVWPAVSSPSGDTHTAGIPSSCGRSRACRTFVVPDRCCPPRQHRSGILLFRTIRSEFLSRRVRAQTSSRAIGQDMHRGPPRPEPSSEPAIAMTSMPASSRRLLVSMLRS